MVTFEKPPTDEELRSFVDPQGTPPYVRLEDDGTTLTARPKSFPMWFVWVCLLVPATGMYAALAWEWSRNNDPLFRVMAITTVLFVPVAVIGSRFLIGAVLKEQVRHDDFFTLDGVGRARCTLPRAGVTFRREDVVETRFEVHATHWVKDSEGWSGEYIRSCRYWPAGRREP